MPDRRAARWVQIWTSRRVLLGVARRCGSSVEDAEDAVQEAMLRAGEHPEIDANRLQPWLCAVTMRLCMDGHRRRAAEARRWERTSMLAPIEQPGQSLEEEVCQRSEAAWIASLASELLPPRQIQALWLAAAGCTVEQVASHLGVRYRAAESLLARARRTLRDFLIAGFDAALTMSCTDTRTAPDRDSGATPRECTVRVLARTVSAPTAHPVAGPPAGRSPRHSGPRPRRYT